MLLDEYWKKRHFERTPEPRGKKSARHGDSFVIQKHAASRLHYDFRLEINGVLKSWAVPKGPSLDPGEKRLAVHVEDHPLEYAGFEGLIPQGEYGGGTVMLWDKGTWECVGNPQQAYDSGSIKFILNGSKLHGLWALVRMRNSGSDKNDNWLLIKENDDYARPGSKAAIVEELPLSVVTQRNLDQIAGEVGEKSTITKAEHKKKSVSLPKNFDAPSIIMPDYIAPQLATLVDTVPSGDDWIYEIKYDGYRILACVDEGQATLFTRNANDWTAQFSSLCASLEKLPLKQAWLDGEIVCLDNKGKSDFGVLQDALSRGAQHTIKYMIFDIMYFNGYDLRNFPLLERKTLLKQIFAKQSADNLAFSDHFSGNGADFHHHACDMSLEGVIAKRPEASYHSHRTRDWLKIKCMQRQEFVIAGFTEGSGSRQGFGALLLGTYEGGDLRYNGRVGTGFNTRTLIELSRRLDGLKQAKPAFVDPPKGSMAKGVHWVKPELVAEIEFHNWTHDGSLRHPSFRGLRADKAAREVTREVTVDARSVTSHSISKHNDNKASTQAARIEPASAVVTLSHPDKLLFTGGGTKEDLAAYYRHVERWVLPHVIERPLTLVRCPGGTDKSCFFQKHIHDALPDSIHTVDVSLPGAEEPPYLWIDSIEGLIALVQIDVLEIHTWGSQVKNLNRPDRIIFDLDPDPGVVWERIAEAALLIRNRLDDLGLISFVKITGGKGLHIVAPIEPELGWDEVKNFSKQLAQEFADRKPSSFTASLSKARRTDKIFIDYLRNGRGATAVAAYSTRAKAAATVSVPIGWEELVIDRIKPDQFTLFNLFDRLQSLANDPWQDYNQTGQSLKNAIKSIRKTR